MQDVKAAFSIVLMTGALFHGHSHHGRSSGSKGVNGGKYDETELLVDGGVMAFAIVATILGEGQDEEFDREFFKMEEGTTYDADPTSGIYLGLAREVTIEDEGETITTKSLNKVGLKKDIEQSSRADLAFRQDGTVTGKGFDYIDGPFTIVGGQWRGSKVRWSEEYEEGFSTMVRGSIENNGKLEARYISSRRVRGEVSLTFSGPLDGSGLVDEIEDAFL